MPELPDIEALKQYVDATSLHKEIESVCVCRATILEGISERQLQDALEGRSFTSTERYGKYLGVALDDDPCLVLHFGMSGSLKYFKRPDQEPAHDRLLISFANGFHLAYDSQRMLGQVLLADSLSDLVRRKELGPDALDPLLDLAAFQEILAGRRAMAKSFLMDQRAVAGLGNVYADEVLFQARIHPRTPVHQLEQGQIEALYHALKDALSTAVRRHANVAELPDTYLLPHRARDGKCPECGAPLETTKIGGRTSYYCPRCQLHNA